MRNREQLRNWAEKQFKTQAEQMLALYPAPADADRMMPTLTTSRTLGFPAP